MGGRLGAATRRAAAPRLGHARRACLPLLLPLACRAGHPSAGAGTLGLGSLARQEPLLLLLLLCLSCRMVIVLVVARHWPAIGSGPQQWVSGRLALATN
jgi:hypothetical protein